MAKATRRSSADSEDEWEDAGRGSAQARIRQLVQQRNEARADLETLAARVGGLEKSYEAKFQALREDTAKELNRITGRHAEDLALHDTGLTDPLGRSTLRQAWEDMPATARGKSPVEWWRSTLAAHEAHHKGEAEEAPAIPRPLQAYLPPLEGTKSEGAAPGLGAILGTADRGAGPAGKGLERLDLDKMSSPEDLIRALRELE